MNIRQNELIIFTQRRELAGLRRKFRKIFDDDATMPQSTNRHSMYSCEQYFDMSKIYGILLSS